jgi:hypothetical protein
MSDETEPTHSIEPIAERTVLFYDDQIRLVIVQQGGQQIAYVPLRPICEFLGVAWSPQLRRINRDPILAEAATSVTVTVTEGGQRGQMLCLPLDYLNGWLFGINASRVKDEVRDRLLRYQRECYQALAQAFGGTQAEEATSPTLTALAQVREMGLAIVRMAEEQMAFERRLATTENRLDQAAVVYGDLTKRVRALEQKILPGDPVTEEQASQISQGVKTVALTLGKQTGKNEFGAVYGELYRRFGITSYKLLPASRFAEAMKFLTEWFLQLGTGEDVPF